MSLCIKAMDLIIVLFIEGKKGRNGRKREGRGEGEEEERQKERGREKAKRT